MSRSSTDVLNEIEKYASDAAYFSAKADYLSARNAILQIKNLLPQAEERLTKEDFYKRETAEMLQRGE